MKIHSITASNVKRLHYVSLKLEGKSLLVCGRNEQGKSSFVDLFQYAFCGAKAIPEKVISNGESKSEIYIDLTEEFRIEKVIHPDRTEFIIRPLNEQTAKHSSPQDIANKLFGAFTFDPLGFIHEKKEKQIEILKTFLPNQDELKSIDQSILLKFNARAEANKEHKKHKLNLEKMREPEKNLPDKVISIAALSKEKDELNRLINEHEEKEAKYLAIEKAIDTLKGKIANNDELITHFNSAITELRKISERLLENDQVRSISDQVFNFRNLCIKNRDNYKEQLAEKQTEMVTFDEKVIIPNGFPKTVKEWHERVEAIQNQIGDAESLNEKITYRNSYWNTENEMGDAKVLSDRLTDELEELRKQKTQLFENANFPVKGLTFDENGIYLDEIPFENLSTSRQILTSAKIGMSMNPKFTVMFSKHGNDMDDERIIELLQYADPLGYQLIIERRSPVAGIPYIIIDDGRVIEENLSQTKKGDDLV